MGKFECDNCVRLQAEFAAYVGCAHAKADQGPRGEAGQELEQFFAASLDESTRLEEARGEEVDGPGGPLPSRVGHTSLSFDSR